MTTNTVNLTQHNLVRLGVQQAQNKSADASGINFADSMNKANRKTEQSEPGTRTSKEKPADDAKAVKDGEAKDDTKKTEATEETEQEQSPKDAAEDAAAAEQNESAQAAMAMLMVPVVKEDVAAEQPAEAESAVQPEMNIMPVQEGMEAPLLQDIQMQDVPAEHMQNTQMPAEQMHVQDMAAQQAVPEEDTAAQDASKLLEMFSGQTQTVVSNEAERTVDAGMEQMTQEQQKNADSLHHNDQNTVFSFSQQQDAVSTIQLPESPEALQAPQVQQSVAAELFEQVQTAVVDGKSDIYIQLKPDVLGGIAIHLAMTDEGLRAQFRTTSHDVQYIMNEQITEMTNALKDKGIQVVQMDVIYSEMADFQHLNQEHQSHNWQSQPNGHGVYVVEEAAAMQYESAYESMMPVDIAAGTESVVYSA